MSSKGSGGSTGHERTLQCEASSHNTSGHLRPPTATASAISLPRLTHLVLVVNVEQCKVLRRAIHMTYRAPICGSALLEPQGLCPLHKMEEWQRGYSAEIIAQY